MAKSTWFQGVTALRYLRMEMPRFVHRFSNPQGWKNVLDPRGMPVSTRPVSLGQSHLGFGAACSQSGYEVLAARAGVASCGYLLRDRTRGRVGLL